MKKEVKMALIGGGITIIITILNGIFGLQPDARQKPATGNTTVAAPSRHEPAPKTTPGKAERIIHIEGKDVRYSEGDMNIINGKTP